MRIDAGIDWNGIMGRDRVARLYHTPFLYEAGSLLQAAGHAWPGRVRGAELIRKGGELCQQAQYGLQLALSWSGDDPEGGIGSILRDFRDQRSYRPHTPHFESRDHEAAARLCAGGIALIEETVVRLRFTKEMAEGHAGDIDWYTEIRKLEDELELLHEHPSADRRLRVPLDEESLRALHRRAMLRACEGLIFTGVRIVGTADREWGERFERAHAAFTGSVLEWEDFPWGTFSSEKDAATAIGNLRESLNDRFSCLFRLGRTEYERFALQAGLLSDEIAVLNDARDDASACTQSFMEFVSEADAVECVRILWRYVGVMLGEVKSIASASTSSLLLAS